MLQNWIFINAEALAKVKKTVTSSKAGVPKTRKARIPAPCFKPVGTSHGGMTLKDFCKWLMLRTILANGSKQMRRISFESRHQTARFHSPLKNGQLDTQEIEVRVDPLTGHQSVANPGLADKAMFLFPDTDPAYLAQRALDTQKQCFLCEGKWQQTTPRYDHDLIAEGRLVKGEVVLFPTCFHCRLTMQWL